MQKLTQFGNSNSAAVASFVKTNSHSELKRKSDGPIAARHGFPHLGHPSQKYSLNWEIDQAGSGWLSLGNYFGYSTVLIKRRKVDKSRTRFSSLQLAFHENIVGLVEAFQDDYAIYLAYNYHGFAVNLSQVASTPAVHLSEPDLAGICRSVLRGLEYIHEQLHMGHGSIDCGNILLCPDGAVKIANIGNSMIDDGQTTFELDREKVGSLLLHLSDAQLAQNAPQKQAIDHILGSKLSKYAMHFVEQVRPASYSYLFEHVFLQQADPDGRTWYLLPHYLDTIMYWGVLPQETEDKGI